MSEDLFRMISNISHSPCDSDVISVTEFGMILDNSINMHLKTKQSMNIIKKINLIIIIIDDRVYFLLRR